LSVCALDGVSHYAHTELSAI